MGQNNRTQDDSSNDESSESWNDDGSEDSSNANETFTPSRQWKTTAQEYSIEPKNPAKNLSKQYQVYLRNLEKLLYDKKPKPNDFSFLKVICEGGSDGAVYAIALPYVEFALAIRIRKNEGTDDYGNDEKSNMGKALYVSAINLRKREYPDPKILKQHRNLLRILYFGEGDFSDIKMVRESHRGPNMLFFVTELLEGLNMDGWRLRLRSDPKEFKKFICDVSSGLKAMHDCFMVHRDINVNNICVRSFGTFVEYVIIDYGLHLYVGEHGSFDIPTSKHRAMRYGDDQKTGTWFPEDYNARPKVLMYETFDVFSLGYFCFLVYAKNGRKPKTSLKALKNDENSGFELEVKECGNKKIRELIRDMGRNVNKRITVNTLVRHAKNL